MAEERPPTRLKEFDVLRSQARQRARTTGQQAQDALKRRFASIGGLGSGALIKQQQEAIRAEGQQSEQAQQAIDAAEAQEVRRRDETAIERAFREKQFGAQQEQFQKQLETRQEQFEKQFGAQEQQRQFQRDLATEQFGLDKKFKEQQLTQQEQQFELDRQTQLMNRLVAANFNQGDIQAFLTLLDRTGEIPSVDDIRKHQQPSGAGQVIARRDGLGNPITGEIRQDPLGNIIRD
jgi:ATP-dependent Lon protease